MFKRKHYILFVLSCISSLCYAQLPQHLNFRTLTEKDGLSDKKINSIAQDKNGIIWIGSYNGLNRYDGNRVKTFYTDNAGSTFGEITYLQATENGLWICTPSKVFYMFVHSERVRLLGNFVNAAINKQVAGYTLVDDKNVFNLPSDEQMADENFHVEPALKRVPSKLGYNQIIYDKSGQPWSFYGNSILRLNKQDLKIEQAYIGPGTVIQKLFFDAQNRCWVGTWGKGAFIFDPVTGSLNQFNIGENNFVVLGFSYWQQKDKRFLVLASDHSLILVDEANLEYKIFNDIGLFRINSGFTDKDNNLWLACEDAVRLVSFGQDLFTVIPIMAPSSTRKAPWVTGVYSIRETTNSFWLGKRYLGGIFEYDKNWYLKQFWPFLSSSGNKLIEEHSREVFDFSEDNGRMYITSELGLFVLNGSSEERLLAPEGDSNRLPQFRNIERENDSTWWIRSYTTGIYIFNPRTEKFVRHYSILDQQQQQQPLHYILRTKKGEVFATTFQGLYSLGSNQEFKKISIPDAPSEYMLGMAEDKNGILWITSSNGMFAFDPASKVIVERFKGFPEMGFCYRVTVDDYNNVWFNCQKGYWCWMQSRQQMLKFNYDMGLPDNRLEAGITKGPTGIIYAGANDAVVAFDPAFIMNYSVKATAIITDVLANHLRSNTSIKNDSTQILKLQAGSYDLLINFSVTDYATPGNYELYYKIEPGIDDWSLAENGSVNFSGLEYGDYSVKVKGRNNLTGGFSKPYFLLLHIDPHWYQTNFFKLILLAAIIALVLILFKRRVMKVRKDAQFKQKIAESEMSVLRSQMNPHFIFNSLNSIENFIFQNEQRQASDYLIKFSNLIRTILEINQLHLIPFSKDMQALRWYIDLEQIRFPQKFNINIQIDPAVEEGNFYVPPMIVQPFIENAIVHGIAHSKHDGHDISMQVSLEGDFLQYIIQDDGIGMEGSAAINELNKPGHKSVGLQITRERIRLHNQAGEESNIEFRDRQPVGTIVTVKIKVKNHDGTKSNIGR